MVRWISQNFILMLCLDLREKKSETGKFIIKEFYVREIKEKHVNLF